MKFSGATFAANTSAHSPLSAHKANFREVGQSLFLIGMPSSGMI
jgi:hypothetical protein